MNKMDMRNIQISYPGLSKSLNGKYGIGLCYALRKHLKSKVLVVHSPIVSHKRKSMTFPADAWVWNFIGFTEEQWRHSLLDFFVSECK